MKKIVEKEISLTSKEKSYMGTKVTFYIVRFNVGWLEDCNKLEKYIDFGDYQEYTRKEDVKLEDLR